MKFIRYYAEKLCGEMVERKIVKEEDRELYIYGMVNGVILAGNLLTAILIGILTGRLDMILAFLLFYASLRTYSGGYHLESKLLCYLFSTLILPVPVYTQKWVQNHVPLGIIIFLGILAVAVILVLAPVESIHKRLEPEEHRFFRRVSHCIVSIQTCIVVGVYYLELDALGYAGYVSILLVAFFMIIGQIHAKRYT